MTHQNKKVVVVLMDLRKLKSKPDTNLPSFSKAKREKLMEEAVVDAYGEEEHQQVGGFLTMMEEYLALPFSANILGVEVVVEKVDMSRDGQIVAAADFHLLTVSPTKKSVVRRRKEKACREQSPKQLERMESRDQVKHHDKSDVNSYSQGSRFGEQVPPGDACLFRMPSSLTWRGLHFISATPGEIFV